MTISVKTITPFGNRIFVKIIFWRSAAAVSGTHRRRGQGVGWLQYLSIFSMLELSLNFERRDNRRWSGRRGYLPLHLVILAPICCLMPQLPWSMARVTSLMAQCQNQHICRSTEVGGVRKSWLLHWRLDWFVGTTFQCFRLEIKTK